MGLKPLNKEQSLRLIELRKQLNETNGRIERLFKLFDDCAINSLELNVGLSIETEELDRVMLELKKIGER